MKLTGPYLTLAGGLAAAGVLLVLSNSATSNDEQKKQERAAAVASLTPPETDAPASPAPAASTAPPVEVIELVPPGSYAGSMKGGDASIAVAVKGGTAIAYICDGSKVEAWMQGKAHATSLKLKGSNKSTLTGKFYDGKLSGTVKAGGKKWTFAVKAVHAPSGLYRSASNVRKAKVVSGWIVYSGKQVGMVNSSTDGESAAPPLDLTSATAVIDGDKVQAALVDGSPVK